MLFVCPSSGDNVQVGPGPSSGAAGTVCVCGVANVGLGMLAVSGPQFVRVRVLDASAPQPSPDPSQPGDVDTDPDGSGNFTAAGVWVPSAGGAALVAYAWLLDTGASGGSTTHDSGSVSFTGGGASPRDCCASCPAGNGSSTVTSGLAQSLASKASLDVTVPDGKNAGIHKAKSTARLKWQVAIGGVHFAIGTCAAGKTLVIQGPSFSLSSKAIALKPFSATFAGDYFGATKNVVVT